MRIALVAPTYLTHRDGLKRHIDQLARGLAAHGAEVEILTQGPIRGERQWFLCRGACVRSHPMVVGRLSFPVAPGLYRSLRAGAGQFDVVDLHSGYAPMALAAARAGARLVLTPFGAAHRLSGGAYLARAAVDSCSQVICSSAAERKLLGDRFPAATDRLRLIRPGVDVAAIEAAPPFTDSPQVVVAVGRLTRSNRIDRAIAALAALDPSLRLVVLGDGPGRARLQAYAAELSLSSRVDFAGPVSETELYRWLRTARAVLALPDETASGFEILEALTAGAPVVVSDLPAHREAVSRFPSAGAVFVPPNASPLRVADAIANAQRQVQPLSNGFRPRSFGSVVEEMWGLYRDLVHDSHASARSSHQFGLPPAPLNLTADHSLGR